MNVFINSHIAQGSVMLDNNCLSPRRLLSGRFRWQTLLLALFLVFVAPARGDEWTGDVQLAVRIGSELEGRQNWREAVRHYKAVQKRFPEDQQIALAVRRCENQYAIDRRYGDDTFRKQLKALPREAGLQLFEDVLMNAQTYYVESIQVSSLVAHGTESLWLALENQKFIDENLFGAAPAKLQGLQRKLYERYWNKPLAAGEYRRLINEVCDLCFAEVGLESGPVVMEYVFGLTNCLDAYSNVLTPGKRQDLYGNIKGQFVGIGIVMEADPGVGIKLMQVLPESPAAEGGLQAGDRIVLVDDRDIRDFSVEEAASLLTGPAGSIVTLEVSRNGREQFRVQCKRREVRMKSIPLATMIDGASGIGYIQMVGFQQDTVAELDAALRQLQQQGMKKLIWDVRGNPGGLLTAAVEVLDRFIAEGKLVETRGRVADQNVIYNAHRPGTWDGGLVLLIDENSASASEIVAGAIQDHKRGTLIGRTSYGKWSVQSIYDIRLGAAVRITTATFYSPKGQTWGKIGLQPDIVVQNGPANLEIGRYDLTADPDLREALRQLQSPSYTQR